MKTVVFYKDCGLRTIKYKVYKVRRLYFILVKIKKIMEKVAGDNYKKISLEAFPPRTLWWTMYKSATFTDPQHPSTLPACVQV